MLLKTGLLWLDADARRSLEEKVRVAAEHYQARFGAMPDLCAVNPQMLAEEREMGAVKVIPLRQVLPNHFWLGMAA